MGDIQLAGSFLIGGMVLLTILSMNVEILETSSINTLGSMAQENMMEIASILDYDFKKIGHGVPRTNSALLAITDSTISFLSDIDQDDVIDTVAYRVGSAAETSSTDNPDDRYLYRSVNGAEYDVALGITSWEMDYFNENMVPTSSIDSVRVIQISLEVGTMFGYNENYGRASWSSQFAPKNLGVF
ncbi:MAG: hypothetical protein K9N35_00985 [Candidatus Marinimicrobia bacterium]|nr:hypothetical protein [Candidatus Neomarinimicrobiota bacterium]